MTADAMPAALRPVQLQEGGLRAADARVARSAGLSPRALHSSFSLLVLAAAWFLRWVGGSVVPCLPARLPPCLPASLPASLLACFSLPGGSPIVMPTCSLPRTPDPANRPCALRRCRCDIPSLQRKVAVSLMLPVRARTEQRAARCVSAVDSEVQCVASRWFVKFELLPLVAIHLQFLEVSL